MTHFDSGGIVNFRWSSDGKHLPLFLTNAATLRVSLGGVAAGEPGSEVESGVSVLEIPGSRSYLLKGFEQFIRLVTIFSVVSSLASTESYRILVTAVRIVGNSEIIRLNGLCGRRWCWGLVRTSPSRLDRQHPADGRRKTRGCPEGSGSALLAERQV